VQYAGSIGDTDPGYPQHVRQECVRKVKIVRVYAVAGHQQPTRKARLRLMKAVARGGLRWVGG